MSNERSRRPTARIARPGSGSDCTSAQTSSAACSAVVATEARFATGDHAAIDAVVVRDIAARTQQADAPAAPSAGLQRRHDEVEDGRAAGRQQHLVGFEQVLAVALRAISSTRCHQRVGVGAVDLAVALCAQAFVALDAARRSAALARARRASASASSCVRQPVRPPATPISSSTSNGALPDARDQASISSSCAGESTRNTTRRSACARCSALDAGQVGVGEHLVGDQAARARRPPRRPRAASTVAKVSPQAPASSWRRNSCGDIVVLPCGARSHAARRGITLHPAEVVLQRVALEHRQRQRQVAGQHVPACVPIAERRSGALRAGSPCSWRRAAGRGCRSCAWIATGLRSRLNPPGCCWPSPRRPTSCSGCGSARRAARACRRPARRRDRRCPWSRPDPSAPCSSRCLPS